MKNQKGLTLIEMVIAISLLAIMISAIVFSFDGSKSRAQVLVAAMSEYGGALERLKTDGSCYPRSLAALFERGDAAGAVGSYCGADLSKQWNGPYVKSAPTRAAPLAPAAADPGLPAALPSGGAHISMAQLSPDLTLRILRAPSVFGGVGGPATWKWFIVADGVPSEILNQALAVCNGTDDGTQTAPVTGQRKCTLEPSSVGYVNPGYTPPLGMAPKAEGAPGSIAMLFNESRQ